MKKLNIKDTPDKIRKKLGKTVTPDVRICVECGSHKIIIVGKKEIRCVSCGSSKRIYDDTLNYKFKVDDKVRIEDSEKSKIIYIVKNISKSYDGDMQYLLKSNASPIKILFHEEKDSYLKKVKS
jgi:DNA-directed RNA polymerase subunit RPC12/RpoP